MQIFLRFCPFFAFVYCFYILSFCHQLWGETPLSATIEKEFLDQCRKCNCSPVHSLQHKNSSGWGMVTRSPCTPCPPEFRLHCSSCPQIETDWNKGGCWEPGQL
jgi:hypothetical protein